MKIKRNYLIKIAPAVLLVVGAYWLLGSDFFTFLIWWEMICLLGLVFMPVTSRIFRGFDDNGWMFSKVLAVAVCGYVQWLLACLKITPFTGMTCVIITVICCLGSILYGIKCKNRITNSLPWEQTTLVYREEILFFLVFLFWTYLAGFHPAAHGTEKYMDFGFMKSMMRSTTRFIGFDPPVTGNETIHEFHSYSFVLGDLHAHVINVFFVLAVLGILYAWIKRNSGKSWKQKEIFLLGLFLGIFLFSNTWDFMIYYVVICGTLFFGNLKRYLNFTDMKPSDMRTGIKWSVVQWIELLLTAVLVSLPFHLQFKSVMVQGIGIVKIHTAFYQFCVLWAFPLLICGLFVVSTLIKNRNFTNKKNRNLFYKINVSDLYGVVLSLCAMGLILIPEIVYVRDIYEKTAPRANTMFKLTYQAYILFALMMSYILVFFVADRIKILQETKLDNRYEKKVRLSKVQITVGGMAIILLISTCGYFVNATTNWFTGFPLKNKYQTLNATAYIENAIPEDAAAIRWLNKNITGQPTVLEACGDSYKDYDNRVSAMTGLPTVLGWYVHEWLWRNNLDEENKRRTDVETIYTSTDKKEVQELLEKYEVNYIFIGSCEYQKYEGVNVALLSSLGEIVFKEENTMIVKL